MVQIQQALNFNPIIFVLQIIVLLVLVQVMNALFWRPISEHIAQREKGIEAKYSARDALQHEMEALRADYLARIAVVEAEARSHIQAAIKEAQTERERLIAEARERAEETIKQNAATLENEKSDAMRSQRDRMIGIGIAVANSALGATVDRASLARSIDAHIPRQSPA